MKNYSIPFSFTLFNGEEVLCHDIFDMTLSESDIRSVAKAMTDRNGGHPLELADAGTINDKIAGKIISEVLPERFPDLDSYDDVCVEVQEDMPEELIAAADEYIPVKSADVRYYASVDGKDYNGVAPLGLSPSVFNVMVEAATKDHHGLSDFDFLKEYAPDAFSLVLEWTRECAFKENFSRCGVKVDAVIREFPLQVYERVF